LERLGNDGAQLFRIGAIDDDEEFAIYETIGAREVEALLAAASTQRCRCVQALPLAIGREVEVLLGRHASNRARKRCPWKIGPRSLVRPLRKKQSVQQRGREFIVVRAAGATYSWRCIAESALVSRMNR
jgi:hypothetical protein